MEAVLDALAAFLAQSTAGAAGLRASDVTWVLGDVGMSDPEALPFGFIAPLNDKVEPYSTGGSVGGSRGVDMDAYSVPLLLVQDVHKYEDPVASAGTSPPTYESPGYRSLLQLAQNVRAALRSDITLGGVIATSTVSEIRYVLVQIGDKLYRGCRLTWTARQRRSR